MKKSFLMILAAAALVSCSKSEVEGPEVGGDVQIALRSNTLDASGVASRAPFAGAISATNPLVARVVADDTQTFSGAPIANGTMTFKGNLAANFDALDLVGSSRFPDGTNYVYLYGVYPSTWTVENGGAANFTFTGKEDVMATERISTLQQDVIDGNYKVLSFKHLLTRLEVKLSAYSSVVSTLGDVTSIKLIGSDVNSSTAVNNKVAITNNGAAMTQIFSSVSATSLDFYGLSLDANDAKVYTDVAVSSYTFTDTPTFVGYSMVAPVTATELNEKEYFLEINTSVAGIKRVAVDLANSASEKFVGSTAGRSFIVSINFKSDKEISVDVEVEDWIEEGEWQGEVSVD